VCCSNGSAKLEPAHVHFRYSEKTLIDFGIDMDSRMCVWLDLTELES